MRQEAWVCRENLIHFRQQLRLATCARHRSLLRELISDQKERLQEIEQQQGRTGGKQ